ncbi:MAG TPA: hypothetical protein VFJ82_25255 [Longimicrobium sp.]|nr:hypothetical protein [Longimicrobium sp.]
MAPAPVLPASRLAAPAADVAPQTRRANGTRTGLIVLGVVAAVVVLYFAVGGGANTDY